VESITEVLERFNNEIVAAVAIDIADEIGSRTSEDGLRPRGRDGERGSRGQHDRRAVAVLRDGRRRVAIYVADEVGHGSPDAL
jgi:hypothetical protein